MVWSECSLAFIVQVSTHLAMLPNLYLSARVGEGVLFSVGLFTLLTSLMYHVCEVLSNYHCFPRGGSQWHHPRIELLGMDTGKWHRLDNVFAITSIQLLSLHLCDIHHQHQQWYDFLRWSCISITLFFQELGPWNIRNTIIPIIPTSLLLMYRLVLGSPRPRLHPRWLALALFCLVPAVVCFAKGLDDERDYLRMWHGGWHVSVCAAGSFFALAKYKARKQD